MAQKVRDSVSQWLGMSGSRLSGVVFTTMPHPYPRTTLATWLDNAGPIEFIVENGGYFTTVNVDYHGGLKYPHLERTATAPEVLTAIAKARLQ